jgi:DNA-binding NarL/FixJ family response regulator
MLGRRRPGGPLDALAPPERDVLARVAEGQSNRAIAGALGLSEHAVERRLAGVFAKLDLAVGADGHRRVLAVLAYLRAQDD